MTGTATAMALETTQTHFQMTPTNLPTGTAMALGTTQTRFQMTPTNLPTGTAMVLEITQTPHKIPFTSAVRALQTHFGTTRAPWLPIAVVHRQETYAPYILVTLGVNFVLKESCAIIAARHAQKVTFAQKRPTHLWSAWCTPRAKATNSS